LSATWDQQGDKPTPVVADEVLIIDSEDGNTQKRITLDQVIGLVPQQNAGYWNQIITQITTFNVTSTDELETVPDIQVSLFTTRRYSFEFRLNVESGPTANMNFLVNYGNNFIEGGYGNESDPSKVLLISSAQLPVTFATAGSGVVVIKGSLIPTAAATLSIKAAQLTDTGGQSTFVRHGSTLSIREELV